MRLIDADELINDINNGLWDWDEVQNITGVTALRQTISDIQNTKTVDAVPVDEVLKLRDWLYESDNITMRGLRCLNELLAKYASKPLPKIETGYERRIDD